MSDLSHNRFKAELFDYARIQAQAELLPSLHCLTATTKMLLLSVLDPIGWTTRYIGDADRATVERWRTEAMAQLILDVCGDEVCELIAWAIDNCVDVQTSIINLAGQQGWSSTTGDINTVLDVSIREKNLLPSGYTCDDDHRYGMAVGLVEAIHAATLEVFEAFELATNPAELAAEVSDNVPFWEIASTGADIGLWIQETMYEAYIGAWSETVKDDISCELWCAMADTGSCYLSFDTIFNVYLDTSFGDVPSITDSALTWIAWLFVLELTADVAIVKIASLMGLLAIRFGGSFGPFSLGIRTMETTIRLLADDENSDWSILCDTCPDPDCAISIEFEGVDDPVLTLGSITATKPHNGAKSAEGEAIEGPQEPTPYPGRAVEFRVDLDCLINSISAYVWVQHGFGTGGCATNVKVYAPDDTLIEEINVVNTGVREAWREDVTAIGVGGSYAIITFQFTVMSEGDQSLYVDDITIS